MIAEIWKHVNIAPAKNDYYQFAHFLFYLQIKCFG